MRTRDFNNLKPGDIVLVNFALAKEPIECEVIELHSKFDHAVLKPVTAKTEIRIMTGCKGIISKK